MTREQFMFLNVQSLQNAHICDSVREYVSLQETLLM